MIFCGPVFLCGVNSCEMSVDVLLTDRLPVYFPVKMIGYDLVMVINVCEM